MGTTLESRVKVLEGAGPDPAAPSVAFAAIGER
jgi:hypothetical protein